MRKFLSLALVAIMSVTALTGCGSKNDSASTNGYELALITDVGTIDDKSFNQGSWEGLVKYADENNKTKKYYQPSEATTASYLDTMNLAIRGGAKVIICPGFKFAEAVYDAQTLYPDVNFVILDSQPQKGDDLTIKDNVYAIYYAEQQAGFLAGYAAVKDGYRKLGFMGGMALPAVVNFGYGFLQGAETAAEELGLDSVEVKYHYTGGFVATPEAQTTAASWYQSGTEVIFGCGGQIGNSVMAAAQDNNGKVIGVDVDQSSESDTVITSAMKLLSNSVYDAIKAYYEGTFPGGEVKKLDVTTNSVGLPLETSKFENFTETDYNAVFDKLVSGEYAPLTSDDCKEIKDLGLSIVTVEEVK